VPLSVHHGLQDAQVPPEWSWELCRRLKALKKPVECFSYPGGHRLPGGGGPGLPGAGVGLPGPGAI